MNLDLAPYQAQLVETFRSFVAKEIPTSRVRAAELTEGHDEELWRSIADLDALLVSVPEASGGGGGCLGDAVLVGQELGRGVTPVPYADAVASLRSIMRVAPDSVWSEMRDAAVCTCVAPTAVQRSQRHGQRLSATLSWVPAGAIATFALIPDGPSVLLARLDGDDVERRRLQNLGCLPLATVELRDVPIVAELHAGDAALAALYSELRLLYAAMLVGAGRRALELATAHVVDRRQFGRPIGSFQAVQHRLADRATSIDAAELLVLRAASCAGATASFSRYCAVALHHAARSAELAAKEAVQFFGGYGVTREFDIHLFLRFIKAVGVVARAYPSCTDAAIAWDPETGGRLDDEVASEAPAGEGFDFRPSAARRAWRERVVDFTGRFGPEDLERFRTSGVPHDDQFLSEVSARGWLGISLPSEVGGLGLSPDEIAGYWEAMHYAGMPVYSQQATEMIAAVILRAGPPRVAMEFLPKVLSGEVLFSLGYTEPEAGSDVAAARTTAERVDGGYVINGAKMFTSLAQVATHVFLLARTDRDAPKHRGLSMFVVPLSAPGVEVSAVETFSGEQTTATFYENVLVPDWMRVGAENEGWPVLLMALDIERANIGSYVGQIRRLYSQLLGVILGRWERERVPDDVRRWLADVNARIEAAAALSDRVYATLQRNESASVEAAMAKLFVTEALKSLAHETLDVLGAEALLAGGEQYAIANGEFEHTFRHAQVTTIYGGTSEIQRNVIATRGLLLPSG